MLNTHQNMLCSLWFCVGRFNGVHAVSLFDRDEEIAGQEVHDGDCVAINGLTLQTTPFLNDIVAFVLRTNFYTLEWDADQARDPNLQQTRAI